MTTLFDKFPDDIGAFQLKQYKDHSIEVIYVAVEDKKLSEMAVRAVINELRLKSEGLVDIRSKKVEKISHDKGKTRFIIKA